MLDRCASDNQTKGCPVTRASIMNMNYSVTAARTHQAKTMPCLLIDCSYLVPGTCWFYSTFLFYLDHFTKWDDWDAYHEQAEGYQTT